MTIVQEDKTQGVGIRNLKKYMCNFRIKCSNIYLFVFLKAAVRPIKCEKGNFFLAALIEIDLR